MLNITCNDIIYMVIHMKNDITTALINLHDKTGKEWFSLKEIYEEVERITGKPNANNGASIRACLEYNSKASDVFKGVELYISKGKGTGMYKSALIDRYEYINNMNIGDTFTRDHLMTIFKISGQSGMMKTNTLNALVLTTAETGIYSDGGIENGTIQYTGEGQVGDQTITSNNKTLYYSKDNNLPVYLFSKDKKRRYTFEGRVELYDKPYQVHENDINENDRLVWKFPLRVIYQDGQSQDPQVSKISYKITEIENDLEVNNGSLKLEEGLLEIRKYRRSDEKRHIVRKSKPDYIAEEIVKNHQGIINEKAIFEIELQKMMDIEAQEQVKKMEEFFYNKKENEGYDILSFELNDKGELIEKYIEVKSTKGTESTPIDITDNERLFMEKHIDNYYLYRIYNSESNNRAYKIISARELLDNYIFVPSNFKIYLN